MKASVIIPVKNGGLLFKKVLSAVLSQETPWPFEVLIIDSGSTDGTFEYSLSVLAVRTYKIHPQEFGHGKTRNLGLSLTCGEFGVFLTQDALPTSNQWLLKLVSSVDKNLKIAGAFGRHIAYPDHGPFIAQDIETHFDGLREFGSLVELDDPERYQNDEDYQQALHFFSNNNSCIRRSVWNKIPFDDVDFSEDMVWAKRIIEAGYKKAYADDAIVYHSHSFGFIEGVQRSFDEAWSLKRNFDSKMCPTIAHFFGILFFSTISNYIYGIKKGIFLKNPAWIFRIPISILSIQIGYFWGQRANLFPKPFIELISRDKILQKRSNVKSAD